MVNETKEMVQKGLKLFKDNLPYEYDPASLIFFVDKHFTHINVLRHMFPGCTVLLCHIHTRRYFKEKVFNGKARTSAGLPIPEPDKNKILSVICNIRDAPTVEIIEAQEAELLGIVYDYFFEVIKKWANIF